MDHMPFHFEVAASLFEKADAPKGQTRRIGGVISTESPDRQGEVVLQKGLDFQDFLKSGWFNDNHSKSTTDGKLGYPVEVSHFQKGAKLPNGDKAETNAHWVEGYLLEDWGPADKIWQLGKSLAKTGRGLGFSVEGRVHRRIGEKTVFKKSADGNGGKWVGNTVARASVANVAITDCPVNTDTGLELLAKSMGEEPVELIASTEVDARLEALEKALTMGAPSKTAPEGPKSGDEGGAAVQAKESLEKDPVKKPEKGDKKDDDDDDDDGHKPNPFKKAMTYDEATAWVVAQRPQMTPGAAGRFLQLTRSLKAQGQL